MTTKKKVPDQWKVGELAVFNGLLEAEQLEECLVIQRDLADRGFPVKIGKILIEKYYMDRVTLTALLKGQARQRGVEKVDTSVDIIKFTPDEHDLLVDRVREKRLVQAEQLDECIDIQMALDEHGIDKQLGEICIEKGILSRDIVADVLARQAETKRQLIQEVVPEGPAGEDDSGVYGAVGGGKIDGEHLKMSRQLRFGRLAVEKGLATKEALAECLEIQTRLKEVGVVKRIGEILAQKGCIKSSDIRRILQIQERRMGQVKWSEFSKATPFEPEDERVANILLESGCIDPDAIGECHFVQASLREVGLKWSLLRVILEKGYLDRSIVEKIQAENRRTARLKRAATADPKEGSVDLALGEMLLKR